MRKTETVIKILCDVCGKREGFEWTRCCGCGKDLCHECSVIYPPAISFSGSFDGHYCQSCNQQFLREGGDRLWSAYRRIKHLRAERESFLARNEAEGEKTQMEIRSSRAAKGF